MIRQDLKTIRVLIADDHILLREGFRTLLRSNPEIEIVGAAENGKELVELTRSLKPDVICTDIKMPVMDGVHATRAINREFPNIGIIALTIYDDEHLIVDMMEAGAKGYLIKNAAKIEVLEAIHNVYDGLSYYCKHTSAKLTKMIATSKFNPYKKSETLEFTERERAIIRLICQENSNKEIATILNLSIRTIEGYREKIQEKMGVRSTPGMIIYAVKKGLYIP